jgi:prepilin-type N-terminal cleavage/methylation domain-containing protein
MKIKNEDGYTIIEILVSLVLLSILIMFTTDIFTLVTSRDLRDSKYTAIELAKTEMHKTTKTKRYENFKKEIEKKYILKQKIEKRDNLIYISISISKKQSARLIYELQAIRPSEDDKK